MAKGRNRDKGVVVFCRANQLYWCMGAAVFFGAMTLLSCAGVCVSRGRLIAALGVAAAAGVGTAASLSACAYFAIKRPRLVFEEDVLQMHYKRGDIVGQIPYRNMASVELVIRTDEDDVKWSYLEINLVERKDPDTWWPRQFGKGFHIELVDEYDKPLTWILGRLRTRVEHEREERMNRRR